MSNTWLIVALVAVAAVAVLLWLYRSNRTSKDLVLQGHGTESDGSRDYPKEREDARVARMSVEERDWERASLQRNQVMTERAAALAAQRV